MIDYSIGNKKIGKDTIIFNLTPALQCPSDKLGLCSIAKECYAKKAEIQYPSVTPFRKRQAKQWEQITVDEFVKDIQTIVDSRRIRTKYLRINESGDFRSQQDIIKLSQIATELSRLKIKVYTYTHRSDLNYDNLSDNLTINGSGFMVHNNFTAVNDYSSRITCVGDCRSCHICKTRHNVTIEVKIH